MLALPKTHHLLPSRAASLVRHGACVEDKNGAGEGSRHVVPVDPSAQSALRAHLAGAALGAALVIGTTTVAALGVSLALP